MLIAVSFTFLRHTFFNVHISVVQQTAIRRAHRLSFHLPVGQLISLTETWLGRFRIYFLKA